MGLNTGVVKLQHLINVVWVMGLFNRGNNFVKQGWTFGGYNRLKVAILTSCKTD